MGFCWVSKGNIFNEVENNTRSSFRIQTPDISKALEGRIPSTGGELLPYGCERGSESVSYCIPAVCGKGKGKEKEKEEEKETKF